MSNTDGIPAFEYLPEACLVFRGTLTGSPGWQVDGRSRSLEARAVAAERQTGDTNQREGWRLSSQGQTVSTSGPYRLSATTCPLPALAFPPWRRVQAGREPSGGGEEQALSLECPGGHLPELQTAQLQGHPFADLAGIALHVVIPELAGRKATVQTPALAPHF